MKVQIWEIRSGKIRTVEKRYADILIKMKMAEPYKEPVKKAAIYQTKVMTPEPMREVRAYFAGPDINPLETDEKLTDTNATEQPKRRGRPKKTYDTKVLTAEE